ncbi:MAG: ABC transporter permease [Dehalococcoidia bacterium]|nr:ABC transporter permease [Dehalococcoidia bacterium]
MHVSKQAAASLVDGVESFAAEAAAAPGNVSDEGHRGGLWPRLQAGARLIGSQPLAFVGLAILGMHVLMAIFGPFVAPYSATEFHLDDKLQGPSAAYLFGTDQFGRDIFSRVLIGARSILLLSTISTSFGLLLGVTVGMIAGYAGGMLDEILMRLMDALMAFPSLLLSLLVLTMLGPATQNVVLAIGLVFMPNVARVVRSVALGLRTMEYVDAARVRGESNFYIIVRELLPNAVAPIVVEGAIRVSYAILLAASLGFLGLGIQPPHPDWGLMVSEARHFLGFAPWMVLFPSLGIASLVIGTNLFADGLTRALEPGRR